MLISEVAKKLLEYQEKYGDVKVEVIFGPTSDLRGDVTEVWGIAGYSVVIESY